MIFKRITKEIKKVRFYYKIPGYLDDGFVRLRPLRVFDGPFMTELLKDNDILSASGVSRPVFRSRFMFWWWLKKTYVLLYCIEVDSTCIGFIGLYDLKLGESATVTLMICDKRSRRLGYGTKAFTLFMQNLQRYPLIKKMIVMVKTDNHASLSFWTKLGFEKLCRQNGLWLMFICLERVTIKG